MPLVPVAPRRTVASILAAAVRSWLPMIEPEPSMTLVPTETWLRVFERLRDAERALPARTKRRYRRVKIKDQP